VSDPDNFYVWIRIIAAILCIVLVLLIFLTST